MKPRIHLPKSLLLASLAICFGSNMANAQRTWDTSNTAGFQAGNGIWGTDNFWSSDGTTLAAWPGSAHSATFAGTAGTYNIQISGNQTTALGTSALGGLNFATNGYTLQSNHASDVRTITIGASAGAGHITIASGVAANIGDRVTIQKGGGNGQLDIQGGGTLVVGSGTAGGNSTLNATGGNNASFINANSTLQINTGGTVTYQSSLGLGNTTGGGGNIRINGGALNIGFGTSNLILTNAAAQTASSTITLSSGSIAFSDATNTGGIRFGPGANQSSATTNLSGTLNLDGGTATINRIYMGGTYTGGARYTAIVNLNGGTLRALRDNANFFEGITNANNGSTNSGAFVLAGGASFDSNGRTITVGQVLESGVAGPALDGGLTLNDTAVTKGTLTLSGANTYTGTTTVTAGALAISSTGSIRSGNALTVASGGTANFANVGQTLGAVSNANTTTNALNFSAATGTVTLSSLSGAGNTRFGSNGTVTGGISEGTVNAVGLLTANISGGTVGAGTLSSTTISGGTTTVSGVATIGTLSSGTANLNGATSAITSLNGGTVNLGSSAVLSVSNGTHAGSITGSGGGLTKTSAGTLTLSNTGTYTYTGATNVNAGTLVVNGNISTSNFTVADGATIGGSGTVGALTIQSGGFVNVGNSPGILNTGNYNQAGTLIAEITGLAAGTQHDQLNVTGTVTLSGALDIQATGGTYALDSMIFLILNDGVDVVSGTFSGLAQGATAASFGGFDWIISYEANSSGSSFTGGNDVALRAIPEPSTALLGGLGVLALLRRRRR